MLALYAIADTPPAGHAASEAFFARLPAFSFRELYSHCDSFFDIFFDAHAEVSPPRRIADIDISPLRRWRYNGHFFRLKAIFRYAAPAS
jgi:hypothetical protein